MYPVFDKLYLQMHGTNVGFLSRVVHVFVHPKKEI